MKTFNELSIKQKLILIMTLTSCLPLAFLALLTIGFDLINFKYRSLLELSALANIAGSNSSAALVFIDRSAAAETLKTIRSETSVVLACIYDRNGVLFSTFERDSSQHRCSQKMSPDGYRFNHQLLELTQPISIDKDRIGTIQLVSNLNSFYARLMINIVILTILTPLLGFFAFLLSYYLQHLISDPILKLSQITDYISRTKDYSIRTQKTSQNEVGILTESINNMLNEIETQNSMLQEKQKELTEAVRSRDEFLSIAAHELRTPLTPLRLQIQILNEITKDEKLIALLPTGLRRLLSSLDQQVDRLAQLVNNLLDVARITSGHLSLSYEYVHLSALILEVVNLFKPELIKQGCELDLNVQSEVYCWCDKVRLEQVVINLVSNAMKYAPGQPIHISLKRTREFIELTVRDEGPGIQKEDLKRIFERFERAVSIRNFGGLGLGLYVTRQILSAHHGKIKAESERGKGASFIVELPIDQPNSKIDAKAS